VGDDIFLEDSGMIARVLAKQGYLFDPFRHDSDLADYRFPLSPGDPAELQDQSDFVEHAECEFLHTSHCS
jgi:hypothetical protein